MKQRGFTLIELMIVIVMVMIAGMVVLGAINGTTPGNSLSFGVNGMTEMRCIDGYKFVIGEHGQARQVMDEFGKGVKCSPVAPGKPGQFGTM
jgi:prepilin-type N-terminal cleavage/methylation domain-containing protein